jgi:hypothetical protein
MKLHYAVCTAVILALSHPNETAISNIGIANAVHAATFIHQQRDRPMSKHQATTAAIQHGYCKGRADCSRHSALHDVCALLVHMAASVAEC